MSRVEFLEDMSVEEHERRKQEALRPKVGDEPEPEEEIVDAVRAAALKDRGNALFAANELSEALRVYRRAIVRAPQKPKPVPRSPEPLPAPSRESEPNASSHAAEAAADPSAATDELDYTLTAQIFHNIGAVLMKQQQWEDASSNLSEAIRHKDDYGKAYLRRAECEYELSHWSSASENYEKAEKNGAVLDAKARARQEECKAKAQEEMQKALGQLKEFGNMLLGKFGLSTDNFKFTKDPATGGYSVNFQQ